MSVPTEDERKRADRNGRRLYKCGRCGRWFRSAKDLASMAGPRVSVCGAILNPPEARCMLEDDFGKRWWPDDEPMPDVLEIDGKRLEQMGAGGADAGAPPPPA